MQVSKVAASLVALAAISISVVACSSTSGNGSPLATHDDPTPHGAANAKARDAAALTPDADEDAGPFGPADAADAPECVLDTRAVYVENGRRIESITAYGRYWSRELFADGSSIEATDFPRAVATEPKFASGPCAGHSACTLDSRAIYFDGATKVESTTAYGAYFVWSFDGQGQAVVPAGFPQPLTHTPAFLTGPCAYAGASVCTFDSRTLEMSAAGKIETITAYGRWFQYVVSPDLGRVSRGPQAVLLESIPRLAKGPCAGQPSGACVLDTRTAYVDLDGTRVEEITARGRLWVHQLSSQDELVATPLDGVRLETIPRLQEPCTP